MTVKTVCAVEAVCAVEEVCATCGVTVEAVCATKAQACVARCHCGHACTTDVGGSCHECDA